MEEASNIDGLLKRPEQPLREAFKVFIWSVGAANIDNIEAVKPKFEEKAPFIVID